MDAQQQRPGGRWQHGRQAPAPPAPRDGTGAIPSITQDSATKRLRTGTTTNKIKDMTEAFADYRRSNPNNCKMGKTKSIFEEEGATALIETNLLYIHELYSFILFLSDTKSITYTPDFFLDLFINGKRVLVELHGANHFKPHDIVKFNLFMESYGRDFYLILITDATPTGLRERVRLSGIKAGRIADEIWASPKNNNDQSLQLMLAGLRLRADAKPGA